MSFDSWIYAIFLPVVVGGAWLLPQRAQNLWLLAASLVFYGYWDWRFLGLLVFSTMLDFTCARGIEASSDPRRRKAILLVSVVLNLGLLGVFKYVGFFADSFARLLTNVGVTPGWTTLNIVLPVGISFYTFQTMSYTIDVYRGQLKACRDPVAFGLYVSFFPQLVAGPIERATNLLPQLESRRRVTTRHLSEGAYLILFGLFKKVALADAIAPFVATAFGEAGTATTLGLWRGMYLFTFQIYLDFSGYSDIARGSAKLLGVDLMENFRQPFFATSLRDLWRRWHVSLSTWLRDYLYLPLGGNRGGPRRAALNLLLTMTLSGLWHGAAWTFVCWGFAHGLLLGFERALEKRTGSSPVLSGIGPWRVLRTILVFHLLATLFVVFRA